MAENFTFLDFIKGLLISILIVSVTTIFDDYDKINELYIDRQENFAELKALNDEILATYQNDLEAAHPELYASMRAVEFSETYNKNLAPNTMIVRNYSNLLFILGWVLVLFRWADINSGKNKPDDEIAESAATP